MGMPGVPNASPARTLASRQNGLLLLDALSAFRLLNTSVYVTPARF
jgi:hypothetical protein